MLSPRHITFRLLFILLSCVLIDGARSSSSSGVFAQQSSAVESTTERERGIQLYERGDTGEAIKALRAAVRQNKMDADAWHYLGLAYSRHNSPDDARKAFATTINLRPNFALAHANLAYTMLELEKFSDASREAQNALAIDPVNATAHYVLGAVYLREGATSNALKETEAALKMKADFPAALLLRTRVLIALYAASTPVSRPVSPPSEEYKAARRALLAEAADSLDKYLELSPNTADTEFWRDQLKTLRAYVKQPDKSVSDADEPISAAAAASPNAVIVKARLISKPEPEYSKDARKARVRGTVVLTAILGSDGKVRNILVVRGLPRGLTEKAVEAARQIKFVPAMKDGRPASQYVMIEYNFDIR